MEGKRIESRISKTAEFTCLLRAVSFYEKKPQYKSNDYIAPVLIPKFIVPVIKIGPIKNFFKKRIFPKGMYEYVVARTKYIDSVFQYVMKSGFDQVLIFGAGFDSRSIRFTELKNTTKIFELDAPITQNAKINQLKKRGIKIKPNTTFISIDFNNESIKDKLLQSGFKNDKKSFFILEGLTMYLGSEAIDKTFNIINELSGDGSEVVFDYIYSSVLRGENLYYGESEVYSGVKDRNEPWCFGIEEGEIESFLENKNLQLIQNLNSEDLEREYFIENGKILSKVNGTHAIAYAKIKD
jgi:methyltransferase (TIGR00027 family)